jgi:hypothetical protein
MTKPFYTGLILDKPSTDLLADLFKTPTGWTRKAHHMTLNLGPCHDQGLVGLPFTVKAYAVGKDDKVQAVAVLTGLSKNRVPHVTLAISPTGAAKDSNDLEEWVTIPPFTLTGVVTEV